MKKILSFLIIALFSSISVFAQDLKSATDLYNEGATCLNMGDKANALKFFEQALEQAKTIGAEAAELQSNCQKAIPTVILSIGKEQASNQKISEAVATLNQAIAKAKEYSQSEVATEAETLIPQLYMQNGNVLLNKKDFKGAAASYKKVIEIKPNDAIAYLRLGQSSSRFGDLETAFAALDKAAQLGQSKAANKESSKLYLTLANQSLKAKNYAKALENAQKSIEILPNPTAYNIAGTAAIAMKDFKAAIANFEAFAKASPNAKNIDQIKYQLATSYEAVGDKENACLNYKAILNNPQFKEFANHKVTVQLKCQ